MGRNNRQTGGAYEQIAAAHLRALGYEILEFNFRSRTGEIDIIAREGECLVFVEVKYRSGTGAGDPAEAVSQAKQRRITQTALYYCMRHEIPEFSPMRFDVVAILGADVRLYRNAFEAAV